MRVVLVLRFLERELVDLLSSSSEFGILVKDTFRCISCSGCYAEAELGARVDE